MSDRGKQGRRLVRQMENRARKDAKVKTKLAPGTRVRTNAALARLFHPPLATPWQGVVEAPHVGIAGCWRVRLDRVAPTQYVHEAFLEVAS